MEAIVWKLTKTEKPTRFAAMITKATQPWEVNANAK